MSDDAFRRVFKYYKARKDPPDLTLPLNSQSEGFKTRNVERINVSSTIYTTNWIRYGLKPPEEWEAYQINDIKGLIYVKNPYFNIGQRYWIVRCLRDFPKKPHKLNIDIHDEYKDVVDWWSVCRTDSERFVQLKKSLRWATLGYHHDWDTKVYAEKNRNDFPEDLAEMCKMIVSCFGFENYSAEASIVNYYHMDSTLAPHTDHSEKNLDAPLVSISFGQSAIFLIGGESKSIEPTPIFIHSGDIVIMSKESRLCYHAVPRIVAADSSPWKIEEYSIDRLNLDKYKKDIANYDIYEQCNYEKFWEPFNDYVSESRINLNVRQVLHQNQIDLNS